MLEILLPILSMSVLARMSGGGILPLPRALQRLPEVLFAGGISGGVYALHASLPLSLLALVWSYWWMETGHGTAFTMGRHPETAQSDRKQFLSPVIDPICRAVGAPLGGSFYCWLFMGLKGLLIGLPCFPFGLLLAWLWPLGYEIGWTTRDHFPEITKKVAPTEIGEYLTGYFAGIVVLLCLTA